MKTGMKSLRLHIVLALISIARLHAQNPLPNPYPDATPVNYVRTWNVVAPITNAPALTIQSPRQQAAVTTTYLDGLGRPLQTVVKQGSLASNGQPADVVSPVIYDAFGREADMYLPFAADSAGNNTSVSDGLFKLNPFEQQEAFFQGQYAGERYYYSHIEFEPSPLNRPLKSFVPGNSWIGSNRGVGTSYNVNTSTDAVRIW